MAYQQLAFLYDKLMDHVDYSQWVNFTKSVLKEKHKTATSIVDLGCGTGEITTQLAKAGFNLVGVDYSEDMLSYAAQKASNMNVNIKWLYQDLRNLTGLDNIDVCVSYFDVINYITEETDLKTVFQNVYHTLRGEGIFIFDVHHIDYVKKFYINETFADVLEDAAYIWFCEEGEYPGEMYHDLTFFTLDKNNKYVRFNEYHHQRTYPISLYERLLLEVGFEHISVYADFSLEKIKENQEIKRVFITAEKKSG